MKDDVVGFIGDIPTHYDTGLGPVLFEDYAADMAKRVAALRPARVLETAAGTGIVTRRLRDALPATAALVATDLNAAMLEVAKTKFGPDAGVAFTPADAMQLPFEEGSFDVVVCQFGKMFYPDKERSFREAYRVLAPGGVYLFSVWDSFAANPFAAIAHATFERHFPNDPPQFMRTPVGYGFDAAKEAAIASGFVDISAHVVRRNKEAFDIDRFANGVVFGSPNVDQIRARGGASPETVAATLADNFRAAFGATPPRMPLQAIVFSAAKPA